MQRINSVNARPDVNGTGKTGFSDNADLEGQDATYITPEWCNHIQEEIAQAIEGLYCIGNSSASVMGPAYPGAGSTIGPAMTFGFRAVAHMVGQPIALKNTQWLGLEV